jgi:hypothetical protein
VECPLFPSPLETNLDLGNVYTVSMVGSTPNLPTPPPPHLGYAEDGLMSLVSLVAEVLEQPLAPTRGGLERKENALNLRRPIRIVGSTASGKPSLGSQQGLVAGQSGAVSHTHATILPSMKDESKRGQVGLW